MKRLFTLCFIFLSLFTFSQIKPNIAAPKVDHRVELLSIVFRLAEIEEYSSNYNLSYVQSIHEHFDKFKDHPFIQYIKKIRSQNGIAYDAVMSMAVHLKQPPDLTPIVPFAKSSLDKRWEIKTATKFVELLRQFYVDADCESFFKSQSNNYALAEQRFSLLFKKLDIDWYYKYYGKSPRGFNAIPGLGNGGNNYGLKVDLQDKTREIYAVIGADNFDSTAIPEFEGYSYLSTLIHEFNHSFINYLTDQYEDQLRGSGKIILDKGAAKMKGQHYHQWQTIMSEALVRASVIRYFISHESDTLIADRELKTQLARGFVWMKELVELLAQYENEREHYPTLESFMPRIVSFYKMIAPQIDALDERYLQGCAKVISVQPFNNHGKGISAGTTEIVFNFDKELDGNRYFFGPGKEEKPYPKVLNFSFSNNNKTITMKVKLEPNTEYQVNVHGSHMRTADGYSVQNFVLNFKTGAK